MSLRALGVTRCLVYCAYLPIISFLSLFYILCDYFVYTIIRQITWQRKNIPDVKLLLNGSLFHAPKMKLYLDRKRRDNILLPRTSTAICTRYLSYTGATEKAPLIMWLVVLKAYLLSLHWHFPAAPSGIYQPVWSANHFGEYKRSSTRDNTWVNMSDIQSHSNKDGS